MWLIDLDKQVYEYLTLYCNPPWLTALAESMGNPSTYTPLLISLAVLYYWLNSPRFLRFLLAACLLLLIGEGCAYILKIVVARPRPAVDWLIYVDPKAFGFPSAHAVNTMALAALLSRWFDRSILWYLPLPLLIGASRVLANYHYPLDVIGGWLVGYVAALALWPFFRRFSD